MYFEPPDIASKYIKLWRGGGHATLEILNFEVTPALRACKLYNHLSQKLWSTPEALNPQNL